MQWLKQNALNISITVLVAFTVAYLFSYGFREKVIELKIDAGMVAGLVASFALLFSLKQSLKIQETPTNVAGAILSVPVSHYVERELVVWGRWSRPYQSCVQ
jgi:hypothetical protein